MVLINKKEMEYLRDCGFRFHKDIMKTYTRNCKYYACESPKVLKALAEYRQKGC
jgi:hypothetical protein